MMLPLFLQVADLLVLAEKHWEHLIYQMGDSDVINYVIKKGEVVCQQQIKYLVSSRVVFTNQSLIKQTPKRQIGLQRLRVWIRLGLNCFTGSGSHLSFFQTLVVQKCTKIIKHCRTYTCFFMFYVAFIKVSKIQLLSLFYVFVKYLNPALSFLWIYDRLK